MQEHFKTMDGGRSVGAAAITAWPRLLGLGGALLVLSILTACAKPPPTRSYYVHHAPDYRAWEYPYAAGDRELEVVLHGLDPDLGFAAAITDSLNRGEARFTTTLTTDPLQSPRAVYHLHVLVNPTDIEGGGSICLRRGVVSAGPSDPRYSYDRLQAVLCRGDKQLSDISGLVRDSKQIDSRGFETFLKDVVALVAHPRQPSEPASIRPNDERWDYSFAEDTD